MIKGATTPKEMIIDAIDAEINKCTSEDNQKLSKQSKLKLDTAVELELVDEL